MSEQNVVDGSPEFVRESGQGEFGGDFDGNADDGTPSETPAPGTGQSKSSKRRRRKRKKLAATAPGINDQASDGDGSGAEAGSGPGSAYVPLVMEGESLSLAAVAPVAALPPQQRRHQGGGGSAQNNGGSSPSNGQGAGAVNGQGQGQGQGKRWKKKFRDRERRSGGDSTSGSSGFSTDRQSQGDRSFERPHRREGGRPDNFGNLVSHQHKAKSNGSRERGFVGPMDHSYREASPQFGDVPPSTIQLRGRRGPRQQGDGQPIDHNAPRALPIAEDAQTHIYLFVDDLFITAKVQETARKLGVKVAFIKNEKESIAELTSGEDQNRPSLIVFDLNNVNAKPLTLIPKLKTKLKRSASIIGFLSMIQGDLKAKAVEAGCDTVMPKAAFSQNLPNLLRRYGAEEAEEVNYNY